jgi:hypothetical protein
MELRLKASIGGRGRLRGARQKSKVKSDGVGRARPVPFAGSPVFDHQTLCPRLQQMLPPVLLAAPMGDPDDF